MTQELVRSAPIRFSASDREAQLVGRLLPSTGDTLHGDVVVDAGRGHIPVAAQTAYGFELSGVEVEDYLGDDVMGWTVFPLTLEANWEVGVHTLRGLRHPTAVEVALGDGLLSMPAHYSVEIEIRRAPLPDLVAVSLDLRRSDDGHTAACMTAGNTGPRPSGAFDMSLRVDGAAISGGTARWPGLDVGETHEFCVAEGLPLGQHLLTFDVDLERTVAEMDESNNHLDRQVTITSAAGAATSSAAGAATPTSTPTRPATGLPGAAPTPGGRSPNPQQ